MLAEFSTRTGIVATCEQQTLAEAIPMEVASCLYRVAQEALHNVSKHAQASRVRLILNRSPDGVRLGIHDNGAGFERGRRQRGIGIVSMRERVRLVEGEFSIYSEPGRGTTVSVFVRLARRLHEPPVLTGGVTTEFANNSAASSRLRNVEYRVES
jgi:signal transduction histidine kinase